MPVPQIARTALLTGLLVAAACRSPDGPNEPSSPAQIAIAGGDSAHAVVGSAVGPLIVLVTNANGRPVPHAMVSFVVAAGNGSVSPAEVSTDAAGHAQTTLTLGTMAGQNAVTASVTSVAATARFTAIGVAGPLANVAVVTPLVRLHTSVDTGRVHVSTTDQYGNATASATRWLVRDPTLLAVDSAGVLRVLRRGGTTYVVASAGAFRDSAYVVVLAPGDSPCTGVATATTMAGGAVDTTFASGYVCVHASTAGTEYELVPYFDAGVPASQMQIEVVGDGLGVVPPASASAARVMTSRALATGAAAGRLLPNDAFDAMLRRRERALEPRVASARRWYREQRRGPPPVGTTSAAGMSPDAPPAFNAIPSTLQVGNLLSLNASLTDCTAPSNRVGRVAAITNKAIVVADTANPPGGFTDAEYQSIGTTFDTLVDPLDEQAFGAPTDIDGNKHVVLFFTRAVNAMTPKNSGSVILGFFYGRDLLPRTSCSTSNQGEMFYLMVPDSAGAVTGQAFSKAFVRINTIATTAHEFQHLINASRRMYVNDTRASSEEAWLNEGLSHIAEELLFYRVSGLQPRQNIDSATLVNPAVKQAYFNYHRNNALRYSLYLQATASYAPEGADPYDDALQTRGAIWSFLRYAADRRASSDGDFWYRLVNSATTGMANLGQVLGVNPRPWMHDWAISNLGDDWVPGIASAYTQPSWNTRSYFTAAGIFFPLDVSQLPVLADTVQRTLVLRGGGAAYMRFTVPSGQDALIVVTANGQSLPVSMQLAVVRRK